MLHRDAMKEYLEKANQALLEGDRDKVLLLLQGKPADSEIIWLRAHAAKTDEERLALLRQVADGDDPEYARLAALILAREQKFEFDLNQPADYKFWKKDTFQAKVEALKAQRGWIVGGFIFIVFLTVFLIINLSIQSQRAQTNLAVSLTQTAVALFTPTTWVPTPTPTVTALPPSKQKSAAYPAGSLKVIRVEFPTNRPVSFGQVSGDGLAAATPAVGARFAALQVEFTCQKALCSNPPEAKFNLQLSDGQIITYENANQPVLVEQPVMPRIASGQTISGWLVFEIPAKAVPSTLLIVSGDQDPVQQIDWP